MVGCHYVQHHGLSGEEALARIADEWQHVAKVKIHPVSPQTREQLAFVRNYQAV